MRRKGGCLMEEKQQRKRWTGEEIGKVLRRYLVEKEELSRICEEAGCHPSQVYRWQKELFDGVAGVFERRRPKEEAELTEARERAAELEAKLLRKDQVLAELMEEHVRLKKKDGGV